MIAWQVQIIGQDSGGWDRDKDGCWFPDFDHQAFLLPYFNVGEAPIDEYGRTEFADADMRRLRKHLLYHQDLFEARPDTWTLTDSSQQGTSVLRLERRKVLAVVEKTLQMIDLALASSGTLVFLGD